jgi:hypothetical protein
MIKISPLGWIAIAACACVLSWTKGANLSSQASCNLGQSQTSKFKQLVRSKATLDRFEKEFGRGCKLGFNKRKIVYWSAKNQTFSAQFHTKTKKVIKVKYVKKTDQGSKKEID